MNSNRVIISTSGIFKAKVSTLKDTDKPFLNFDLRDGITWCDFADRETAEALRYMADQVDAAWVEIDARPTVDDADLS